MMSEMIIINCDTECYSVLLLLLSMLWILLFLLLRVVALVYGAARVGYGVGVVRPSFGSRTNFRLDATRLLRLHYGGRVECSGRVGSSRYDHSHGSFESVDKLDGPNHHTTTYSNLSIEMMYRYRS